MKHREADIERYGRQLVLGEIGGRGQAKLLDATIAIVGAGGLGSPAIQYLAAAGIGRLRIIDHEMVDLSNLQRQVIHPVEHLGLNKADSAREAVEALNPGVAVEPVAMRLDDSNARTLLAGADLVLDGTDNFDARYAINRACHDLRVPLVSAAVFRFEGHIALYPHTEGGEFACYQCLFPEQPSAGLVPSCQQAGVLGPLAGAVGCLMAAEAIKWLVGAGESLAGRLLHVDLLAMRFTEMETRRRAGCPVCGQERGTTE